MGVEPPEHTEKNIYLTPEQIEQIATDNFCKGTKETISNGVQRLLDPEQESAELKEGFDYNEWMKARIRVGQVIDTELDPRC
tara:strand:- start:310 stop:555 length:246 start_codon:yes stop_codon:yes gene_type:complete